MRLKVYHIFIVSCNFVPLRLVFIIKILSSQAAFETCVSNKIFLKKINLTGFLGTCVQTLAGFM